MPQFLHSGPGIAGISNQPPARFLPRLSICQQFQRHSAQHFIKSLVLSAANLRKVTGARDILVEEGYTWIYSAGASPLPYSLSSSSSTSSTRPSPHLSAFPISLRKFNQPTNISTRESSSDSRDQTHLRNCDSGLIARAKIAIATTCYCAEEKNLVACAVSLADDYESSLLSFRFPLLRIRS